MRPSIVWGAGLLAYTSAVLQRTTLGVSGLEAADRFGTSASIVATFVVVQLLVYALAQIPGGVLLDAYGARATLTAGALLMAGGQMVLAVSDQVGIAILARVIVGAGDALTFTSAIRLVPAWFPASRVPVLTQLTGIVGQLGQVLSAVPFVLVLSRFGWTPAFSAAAGVAVLAAAIALAVVRDAPPGTGDARRRPSVRRLPADIAAIVRHPATQLGFFTHFASGFPGIAFAMMWGYPYLTAGEGLSQGLAGTVMTVYVLVGIAAGPLIGALTQRHPLRRSTLVILVILASSVPLVALLLWPGPAPLWLLLLLVIGFSVGGPGSSVGFDFPRTSLPGNRLGTATGLVLTGGFLGGLICILLIGVVLDALRPDGNYDLQAFRLAFAVQLPFLVAGIAGMLVTRRALRHRMAEHGIRVPAWREVWRERHRRRI
ncbi:MFS transporter [Brachybacterium hainanense]|uniref:Nitrate/nitrite transporter n=1 Tax=Brachybacterium hainanense TaxID=1541174 RepID=A0ABV6RAE5_9MICO